MSQFEGDGMGYSDDDSYVMVGVEDFVPANTDSEEEHSAENILREGTKSSDLEEDEEFCLDNEDGMASAFESKEPSAENKLQREGTKSSDLDTDEEFYLDNEDGMASAFQSIEPSAENKLQREATKSSDTDNDEEVYVDNEDGMDGKFQVRVPCQNVDGTAYKFPAKVDIKDLVRDHVLAFLPAKSLVKFRTVSKDWDRWIASPFLAHKQSYLFRDMCGFFCQRGTNRPTFATLDQSAYGIPSPHLEFLPEPVVIRSSCNGLLLCQGCALENLYYICNPANEEWKVLPQPTYYHGSEPAIILVFEPSELNIPADFQLICAFHLHDLPLVYFEIYSSKERSWRLSAAVCIELEGSTLEDGGFYMKGFVYWTTSCGKILVFDMKNEFYGFMPLALVSAEGGGGVLTQMQGELCYVHARKQTGNTAAWGKQTGNTAAWEMEIYGGIDMSLKLRIAIDFDGVESPTPTGACRALPCVNGNVMMVLIGSSVYSYDVRDGKIKVISRRNDTRASYLPYVNSLVSVLPDDHSPSGVLLQAASST